MLEKVFTGDLALEQIQDNVESALIRLQSEIQRNSGFGGLTESTTVDLELDGSNSQQASHPYGENALVLIANPSAAASWTITVGNGTVDVTASAAATCTLVIFRNNG